jgi:hypothetical protein
MLVILNLVTQRAQSEHELEEEYKLLHLKSTKNVIIDLQNFDLSENQHR